MDPLATLIVACALILLPVALGLGLRYLSNRNKQDLINEDTVSSLRARAGALKEEAKKSPLILKVIDSAEFFTARSDQALSCHHQFRARIHANLAVMCLTWAKTVLEDTGFKADVPRMTTTNTLVVGLELLKTYKIDPAMEEFQKVWLDEHAHIDAKRLAVMGNVWAFASSGRHQEAAEEEALLVLLPRAAALEGVTITCGVTRTGE
ncbi:MAG: hypothetical protein K2X93_00300 [Candidatus Obscuribacterales bacterium]|nr:hypothetical protein [Candidatus Obscuribacterales bacterium]